VACQVSPLTRLGEEAQASDAPIDKFSRLAGKHKFNLLSSYKSCVSKWKSGSISNGNRG
jgi:hypothetical protein